MNLRNESLHQRRNRTRIRKNESILRERLQMPVEPVSRAECKDCDHAEYEKITFQESKQFLHAESAFLCPASGRK